MATAAPIITPGPFAKRDDGDTVLHPQDPRHGNEPPLEERLLMEFVEDLDRQGITAKINDLVDGAGRAPKCDSEEVAGKIGDFCKQTTTVTKLVNDTREKYNRPLLNAQKTLKGKADGLLAPLLAAVGKLRDDLNRYTREEAARRAEEQRKREEEAQRAREALERENIAPEVIAEVVETPAPVKAAPIARGDYGSRVGTTTVWHHEIESVRQLPDRLLKHPKVVEVLDKLIAAEIKSASGKCEIKGVRIWSDQQAVVR
jgi:hypothetical protein